MKVLITGGAGFIGSNFCLQMVNKYLNDEFICLDLLTYAGNRANLDSIKKNKNFKFINGDIADELFIDQLFSIEKIDTVIHFAAETHVDRSIINPKKFINTNIIGTFYLLQAAKKYSIKRFHLVSTDEVYGDSGSDFKFIEQSLLNPSSPYASTKASAELLALSFFRTYHLPLTISRSSNNFGLYQFPEKLIPFMIIRALSNQPLPIYGDGKNRRDWIHVSDHCSAIDLIVRQGKVGEIYNICSGYEKTNIEIVKMILKKLNKQESLLIFVEDRLGHDTSYTMDCSKIKNELYWEPLRNFDEEIDKTIQWYVENEPWWKYMLDKENLDNQQSLKEMIEKHEEEFYE